MKQSIRLIPRKRLPPINAIVDDRTVIFSAGAELHTFVADTLNICNALSKGRMLTKRWLVNLLSISK